MEVTKVRIGTTNDAAKRYDQPARDVQDETGWIYYSRAAYVACR